jgi:hypothetical protein
MLKNNPATSSRLDATYRQKIRDNLEHVILDRLKHPKITISGDTVESVAARAAFDIEMSCFIVGEKKGFFSYQSLITQFCLHLCPYFKTARHSMVFRDMIVGYKMRAGNGDIPDSINIALRSKVYLWPEIYANKYLTDRQRADILELRDLEFGIAVRIVEMIPTTEGVVFTPAHIGKSQTEICFGEFSPCWQNPEPEMNVKCLLNGTCETGDIQTCMRYEDFMVHFARNGMVGNVFDPGNSDKIVNPKALENLRRIWNAELKMTRVYLDVLKDMDLE